MTILPASDFLIKGRSFCVKVITENKSIEDVGQEIFDLIVRVASGEKSKSEIQGLGDLEFVPWQIGATM